MQALNFDKEYLSVLSKVSDFIESRKLGKCDINILRQEYKDTSNVYHIVELKVNKWQYGQLKDQVNYELSIASDGNIYNIDFKSGYCNY